MNTSAAAVTVLYNPDPKAFDSISSYAVQVNKCFLIDNSSSPLPDAIRDRFANGSFAYQHMGANVGSAAALNHGVRMAVSEGYRFVLTMDQDSQCSPSMVNLLSEVFQQQDPPRSRVAIACPVCVTESLSARERYESWSEVGFCITSGSLIDGNAWKEVGGFDEQLFIDYVDHEYCLRVRAAGYSVMRCRDAVLHHHTGDLRHVGILGFRRTLSLHDPARLFYMTRNGFLVRSRYRRQFPEITSIVQARTIAQAIKSILFGPHRVRRLAFMIRGYRAYRLSYGGVSSIVPPPKI